MLCFLLYMCSDIYPDLVSEKITRRGIVYSLAESPVAYYLTVFKKVVFALLAVYLMCWGITNKNIHNKDESDSVESQP